MALLANKNSRRIKVALCLIAIAMSQLVVSVQESGFSAAQTRSRKNPASQAQKPAEKPAGRPSPTPTLLERLGEPPPPNPLPPKKEEQISPGDVISVETTEVMLPVTVRDADGRLVSKLTRDDFRVFEDDRQQPLQTSAGRRDLDDRCVIFSGAQP